MTHYIPPDLILVIFSVCICIGQTLFASILLVIKGINQSSFSNCYLALFTTLLCTTLCLFYLFDFWFLDFPHLMLSFVPLIPAIPAALYLYVVGLTKDSVSMFRLVDVFHLFPCLIFLLLLFPFYSLNGIEKIEWYYFLHNTYIEFSSEQTYTTQVIKIIKALTIIHGLAYCGVILFLLSNHKQKIRQAFSFSDGVSLNWLRYMTILLLILYALYPILFWCPTDWLPEFKPHIVGISAGCFLISVFSFFGIFQNRIPLIGGDKLQAKSEYSAEEDQLALLATTITNEMEKHQYYRNPTLNIRQLSEKIDVPVRSVSKTINTQLGMNFMEFINRYRVDEAKLLLTDKPDMSILDIAYEVGFNSKTSFYDAFKKLVSHTPSQYRKQSL